MRATSLINVVEPFCLGKRRIASGSVAGSVRLARSLKRGVCLFASNLLGVLNVLRRWLVMQLRTEGLRKGWAALRARWESANLLLECSDPRCARTAMGDAGAGEHRRSRRAEKEAAGDGVAEKSPGPPA